MLIWLHRPVTLTLHWDQNFFWPFLHGQETPSSSCQSQNSTILLYKSYSQRLMSPSVDLVMWQWVLEKRFRDWCAKSIWFSFRYSLRCRGNISYFNGQGWDQFKIKNSSLHRKYKSHRCIPENVATLFDRIPVVSCTESRSAQFLSPSNICYKSRARKLFSFHVHMMP